MRVTDSLIASISQTKDIKAYVQELARNTKHHVNGCPCAQCRAFDSLANSASKDNQTPSVGQTLAESFKATLGTRTIVHDAGDLVRPGGRIVTRHDEEAPKKKKLPIDSKLAASMDAMLGRKH